jgi:quercetin dioxygenase-like cupin family protein
VAGECGVSSVMVVGMEAEAKGGASGTAPGFAPPPHIHQANEEGLLILDGEVEGFCGDRAWQAGSGSLVFLPSGIPHGIRILPRPGPSATAARPHPTPSP